VNRDGGRIQFECIKCGACCREDNLLVTVTGSDIASISAGLGLGSDEMIRAFDFYLVSAVESPEGLRDFPAVNTEQGPAYVALKKMKNGDCIFLKDNLCMIHTIRPVVCMSFPFVFWDASDAKTWGLSAMNEICPGLGHGPDVDLSDLKELADAVLEAVAFYKDFAEEWNTSEENPTVKRLIDAILSDQRFIV
jgi:Fe-S-cluster containining protein